jgi:hypothetical protein
MVQENRIFQHSDADLSESDTRSKLIDPVFLRVLGWREADVRREEPAADGFADYVLGSDYAYLHVEAKRVSPRFRLEVPSNARRLLLQGPHLLKGDKTVRDHLKQTARYSFDLGTDFAILTNGSQFILFRTRLAGKSWQNGTAIVWHSHQDIVDDFARFFSLLSRERVRAGSLHEAFEEIDAGEGVTRPTYVARSYIHNPDREFVRNRFWGQISRVFSPLLVDQPEESSIQDEIIQNCYVRTPITDEADQNIDRLLRDGPTEFLLRAGVSNVTAADSRFIDRVVEDIKSVKSDPQTYVITGGVGSGKTTFLRRYATLVQPEFVQSFCVWLHIDYLAAGAIDPDKIEAELAAYTNRRIRELVADNYGHLVPTNATDLREMFQAEIDQARMTLLAGLEENSPEWDRQVGQVLHGLFKDDLVFVTSLLRKIKKKGRHVVFILDNTDQLGERVQESVFLLAQRLTDTFKAISIVALREEKFFSAYRRGIFDAYGDRRLHLGSPNLAEVIRGRLQYGLTKLRNEHERDPSATASEFEIQEALVRTFIRCTTGRNRNIVRMLACVSHGDMRHALGMFRDFVSSGNTDIDKIANKVREGGYVVPFHEFAKSAILGNRRYFRTAVSHVVNVFARSAAKGASPLTACRILARLNAAQFAPSSHGEGFVDTSTLLHEYRGSFGTADDFLLRGEELLRRGLIESEPPHAPSLAETDAIRVGASGAYYWRFLIRAFSYVDLVFVDTAVDDESLAQKLAQLATISDLSVRFERVRLFLDHLAHREKTELQGSIRRDGVYSSALMPEIIEQIEREIADIRTRTGAPDLADEEDEEDS